MKNQVTVAVCTLRVDECLLTGHPTCPVFRDLRACVNERFNIKEWKTEPFDFLGCKISL